MGTFWCKPARHRLLKPGKDCTAEEWCLLLYVCRITLFIQMCLKPRKNSQAWARHFSSQAVRNEGAIQGTESPKGLFQEREQAEPSGWRLACWLAHWNATKLYPLRLCTSVIHPVPCPVPTEGEESLFLPPIFLEAKPRSPQNLFKAMSNAAFQGEQ